MNSSQSDRLGDVSEAPMTRIAVEFAGGHPVGVRPAANLKTTEVEYVPVSALARVVGDRAALREFAAWAHDRALRQDDAVLYNRACGALDRTGGR